MTKKELTEAVAKVAGEDLKNKQVQAVIDAYLQVVVDELKAGNKVTVNGVGILETVDKPARTGRNPRTGEQTQIAACKAVKFKASKTLKDALNA